MRVVGTQNAHNLISISTDGKLCSWSLDMLSQPQVDIIFLPKTPVFCANLIYGTLFICLFIEGPLSGITLFFHKMLVLKSLHSV